MNTAHVGVYVTHREKGEEGAGDRASERERASETVLEAYVAVITHAPDFLLLLCKALINGIQVVLCVMLSLILLLAFFPRLFCILSLLQRGTKSCRKTKK